jgi:hypothetical protein
VGPSESRAVALTDLLNGLTDVVVLEIRGAGDPLEIAVIDATV